MLRHRPLRARIYQPITRFGVVASDWKYIITISVACYAVPMVLKMNLSGIPLFLIAGPGAMFLTYAFFFWIRIGKEPGWLQHQWRSLLRHQIERGTLAADRLKNLPHSWLK